ncbi:MAG: metal ABC transporter ATP-binding protein [Nitrospirae bacterium]|nr:metal ABC transporter ATP-binding protein [Nitrospirota bacterium]
MGKTDTKAIGINNLGVRLGGREVLKGINLSLDAGLFLGIVGPNGGGKTTLLKVILALIKPDSGSIAVFGRTPDEIIKRDSIFGYLPQGLKIDSNFPARAIDVVLMGRYKRIGMFRWPGSDDRERAMTLLRIMGMEAHAGTPYGRLSGGEQQRISIARALSGEPKILILDEPSTGIDVVGQEDFYHLLKGLQKKLGLTIIMVSHDIGAVTAYVDEIACLNHTLHYHGSPLGALNEEILAGLYGKNIDLLMHTDVCDKCARLRGIRDEGDSQ